jgi:large repetitive protein
VTLSVTNVNEAPSAADKTITINEDASRTFSASDFGFNGNGEINANGQLQVLDAVIIKSTPSFGSARLERCATIISQPWLLANVLRLPI